MRERHERERAASEIVFDLLVAEEPDRNVALLLEETDVFLRFRREIAVPRLPFHFDAVDDARAASSRMPNERPRGENEIGNEHPFPAVRQIEYEPDIGNKRYAYLVEQL